MSIDVKLTFLCDNCPKEEVWHDLSLPPGWSGPRPADEYVGRAGSNVLTIGSSLFPPSPHRCPECNKAIEEAVRNALDMRARNEVRA
jgi:hypothetical protein